MQSIKIISKLDLLACFNPSGSHNLKSLQHCIILLLQTIFIFHLAVPCSSSVQVSSVCSGEFNSVEDKNRLKENNNAMLQGFRVVATSRIEAGREIKFTYNLD